MKRRKVLALVSALVLLALPTFSQMGKAGKRAWDIKDQYWINSVGEVAVSPEGEILLFVFTQRDPETFEPSAAFWTISAGGEPKPLAGPTGSVSMPRWAPDGRRVAYFASDKDGTGLWVMNRDGSGAKKIVEIEKSNAYIGMRGNEICWAPDSKKIAYNAAGPRYYKYHPPTSLNPPTGNDVMVVERLQFRAFYYYSDMRRTYVYVIDPDGGKPEQVSFGEYDYHSITWSPDGRRIACISNRTGRDDYDSNNDICILSTEGKKMVQLTKTIGPEYWPAWSPDGSRIAYLNRLRAHRSKESDAEQYKVYVVPVAGGPAIELSAPLDQWSQSPVWASDSKSVFFTAQNKGRVCLYAAPVSGGQVTPIVEDYGQVGSYSLSRQGEIYYSFQDETHPIEIYRVKVDGTAKQKLTSFNQKFIDEVTIVKPEEFTCKSFDGWEIEGWFMKPLNFKEGRKYPLILNIHGGPHSQYGYNISAFYQYLAANGYAVMYTNPRGSSGYGQKFSDGCVGDLGGGDYKDIMACVDYVLGKYKFIDPNRLGVTGGSYGGYMTNWVITQNNRFKAAVPSASISNLISDWADANPDWFESDGGFMPMDNYDKAWSMSPLKYVKNCKTPTLFIHGAWDFCVNLAQAEEMFTALKKLGVDAVLAIYPNEGHGFSQPAHVIDYHRRALAWFDKYLKKK
jgi:dipeptidyl aminopeptidase/acylaminoacyl peptidase